MASMSAMTVQFSSQIVKITVSEWSNRAYHLPEGFHEPNRPGCCNVRCPPRRRGDLHAAAARVLEFPKGQAADSAAGERRAMGAHAHRSLHPGQAGGKGIASQSSRRQSYAAAPGEL